MWFDGRGKLLFWYGYVNGIGEISSSIPEIFFFFYCMESLFLSYGRSKYTCWNVEKHPLMAKILPSDF